MMPRSCIVPIPCAAATEGVVQLPADSKRPSKLSGAWARRAAWRKVLEHVALGHGNRVVQRKSSPLVGFTSFPVALLLLPATAAASPPISVEATSPSPPLGKLSPPVTSGHGPSCSSDPRSFLAVSFVHLQTRFCYRVQDMGYVPFDKEGVKL